MSKKDIGREFARRKVAFHKNEEWQLIKLWGLFNWGDISQFIKTGELLTDMQKENKVVWVRPSEAFYKKYVEPQLEQARKELKP